MDGDIDVRSTSPGAEKCELQMAFRVRFVKFTLLKRVLDVAMRRENHALYAKLIDFIGNVVQNFRRAHSTTANAESGSMPSEPVTVSCDAQRSIEEEKDGSGSSSNSSGSRPAVVSSGSSAVKSEDGGDLVGQSTITHKIFNRRVGHMAAYALGTVLTVFLLVWVVSRTLQWGYGMSHGEGGLLSNDPLTANPIDVAELRDELRGISSELRELNSLVRDMVDVLRAKSEES